MMNPEQIENPMTSKSATQEVIDRLQYQLGDDPVEVDGEGERVEDGETVNVSDRGQRSELEYDGYDEIEDYDNGSYRLGAANAPSSEEELQFEERPADPSLAEESPVDVQENRAPLNDVQS